MIEAEGLGYKFPGGQWLWRNLDLKISPGAVVGVIGRNGSGKTTLIRTLLRLIKPSEGCVVHRGRAGYVPQHTEILLPFRVRDVVAMGRAGRVRLFSRLSRRDWDVVEQAMDDVGISRFADRPFQTLSGGERQLALIARAIASECETLTLDEPFTGLDLENQKLTLRLLRRFADRNGIGVLFSAHHPDQLFAAADNVLILQKGGPSLYGPVREYLTSGTLTWLYSVDVRVIDVPRGREKSRHAAPDLGARLTLD